MPDFVAQMKEATGKLVHGRDALVAFFLVAILGIMIVPLNPILMDTLLIINITFSLMLLLTTVYVNRPLDFSAFPSILLMITLYRLSLNIATTRLILGNAKEDGVYAAGHIVYAFSSFVAGGTEANAKGLAIGATIFAIIVIVQFVVITKGATRVSEVAARFTLDAMPGHQMAIDADLNAGLIDESQARVRREDLRRQTDFYGSMDGASKFVRGDAIAGIIITGVNVVVGFIIGNLLYDMRMAEAAQVFTLLTIGDGLVGQIPALLVSVASGLLVTRSANRASFGGEVLGQLFGQRKAIGLSGVVLILMACSRVFGLPLPVGPLLVIGCICLVGWYLMGTAETAAAVAGAVVAAEAGAKSQEPEKVERLLHVDPMALEVGYGLVSLVDTGGGAGGLLGRVQMIRRQIATDLGIIVPPVRIRDDIRLDANDYVLKIHGGVVGRGVAIPDRYLAMDSGMVTQRIDGIETVEPAFGLPAVWVLGTQREEAERRGYAVVDAETVVATHLTEVIKNRAHEILTRDEVRRLLDTLAESSPALVQDVIPDMLNIADLQRVLQNLLRERVSIRNLDMILETMGDYARRTKDPDILTEYARNALSRHICSEHAENGNVLYVVTMDPNLEAQIQQSIEHTEGGSFLTLRPADVRRIVEAISEQLNVLLSSGHSALLLLSPQIRAHVKRMTESSLPILTVLSYNEVGTEFQVESMGLVRLPAVEAAGPAGR